MAGAIASIGGGAVWFACVCLAWMLCRAGAAGQRRQSDLFAAAHPRLN